MVIRGKVRRIKAEKNYAREDIQLERFFNEAAEDSRYQMVVEKLLEGATAEDIRRLPSTHPARKYADKWDSMTTVDDQPGTIMVVDNIQLVVPEAGRERILKLLHIPHQGHGKRKILLAWHDIRHWQSRRPM